MKIYILCPVRNVTEKQKEKLDGYVAMLEQTGRKVHYPPRDVRQDDETGYNICKDHWEALKKCDEVHIFWDTTSYGSHFDLGMAFASGKKVRLIETYQEDIPQKSYLKVIKEIERNK